MDSEITILIAEDDPNDVMLLELAIRKNGISTPVTCTISGTGTSCADSVNAVGFATGDLLTVQITQTAGVVANIDFGWTSQFVPS